MGYNPSTSLSWQNATARANIAVDECTRLSPSSCLFQHLNLGVPLSSLIMNRAYRGPINHHRHSKKLPIMRILMSVRKHKEVKDIQMGGLSKGKRSCRRKPKKSPQLEPYPQPLPTLDGVNPESYAGSNQP